MRINACRRRIWTKVYCFLKTIYSFMRNLSKNQLHELKEFFPVGIWNNKSNAERRALGRKFKQAVRECQFKRITSFEVKSNRHTYYFISK